MPLISRLIAPAMLGAMLGSVLGAMPAAAACTGQNLIESLPPAERAAIEARADAAPYSRGNAWVARRDGHEVTLLGTYHLDDPRHGAILEAVRPRLAAASVLLVEAGPAEEKALLDHIARDPAAILLPEGQSLPGLLAPAEWQRLGQAMRDRGLPPFMAARFRPWYVTTLLALPPCAMDPAAVAGGLDKRLIAAAAEAGVPVRALEPWDTALRLMDDMGEEAQLAMIRAALAVEDHAADHLATLAATYFAGRSRLIWEYQRRISAALPGATPEATEAEFAEMEESLMAARNRRWIGVIAAGAAGGPVFAAFGALHLSGEEGVVNLLARAGWEVAPLPLD